MAKFDQNYVKSKQGILKIFEILFTCIVFSCITVAKNGFEADFHEKHESRYRSLRTLNIIGFVLAIVIFVVFWIRAHDFLGSPLVWKIVNVVFCAAMFLGCLVSGIIMAEEAKHEYESDLYKTNQGKWRWYTNHTITAVALSFFAAAAFFIDGIIQTREPAREGQRGHQKTVGTEIVTFIKDED